MRDKINVMACLMQSDLFVEVPKMEVECGDLLCFNLFTVEHHVGVMLQDGQFIHCWAGARCFASAVD